jgi:hypothetical protein
VKYRQKQQAATSVECFRVLYVGQPEKAFRQEQDVIVRGFQEEPLLDLGNPLGLVFFKELQHIAAEIALDPPSEALVSTGPKDVIQLGFDHGASGSGESFLLANFSHRTSFFSPFSSTRTWQASSFQNSGLFTSHWHCPPVIVQLAQSAAGNMFCVILLFSVDRPR